MKIGFIAGIVLIGCIYIYCCLAIVPSDGMARLRSSFCFHEKENKVVLLWLTIKMNAFAFMIPQVPA